MQKYIAILRGINVSGQKKIKMADLRELLGALGFSNLSTYIQSGNILFETAKKSNKELAATIKNKILSHYSFEVPVIVRTFEEWEAVLKGNPFLKEEGIDLKSLYVTFLKDIPAKEVQAALSPTPYLPEDFRIIGKSVYLHCPKGYGRTKLNNNFFERKLKVTATTRNWKSVNKLAELAVKSP